jgi:hypothetical protein
MGSLDLRHHHAALCGYQGGEGADDDAQHAHPAVHHHHGHKIQHDLVEPLALQRRTQRLLGRHDIDQGAAKQAAQIGAFVDQTTEAIHLRDYQIQLLLLIGERIQSGGIAIRQPTTRRNRAATRRQERCSIAAAAVATRWKIPDLPGAGRLPRDFRPRNTRRGTWGGRKCRKVRPAALPPGSDFTELWNVLRTVGA